MTTTKEMNKHKVTKRGARKVLKVVECGLVKGVGKPEPGKMCVEAAVCFALGLPHGDNPPCVAAAVRAFKIALNDAAWPTEQDRAQGMKRLAIAQLGSDGIDEKLFAETLSRLTIQRILPIALRESAKCHPNKTHKAALLKAADECEAHGTASAAWSAARSAESAGWSAGWSAASAARSAESAARSAESAARSAESAGSAASAGWSAASAGWSAASAGWSAESAQKEKSKQAATLKVLRIAADIGIEALKVVGAIGCKWLDIVE